MPTELQNFEKKEEKNEEQKINAFRRFSAQV